MTGLKKNFIYNVFYQIMILILPLITVPYVSRVLGAEGVGIYSYTYSIVYYFMIVSMLGINNYGNRTIAKTRENKYELSKNFFSIYFIQIVMTMFMLLCYLVYVFIFLNKYKLVSMLQIIYLISVMFDINWFFFGLEKFKVTITRSTILKLLSLILIFLFVNDVNDVWIYTLILSGSTLLSQLILLPFLIKEIIFVKIKFSDVKKHIKPCFILFIPVIAISLYKIMDKIMLGLLSTIEEVGYYEQAAKIIDIPMGIVTALGTVMLPRISNLVAKGDNSSILKYIEKSIKFMMFLAFPICFGLIGISDNFIPIFMGNDFMKSSVLVNYLSVTIIFLSFANVIRKQYLVPMEKDKLFILSVIVGAIVNLIINLILIPEYQSIGASIGTIFAELSVMLYQVIAVHKELPILKYLKLIFPFFVNSIIMFIVILFIKQLTLSKVTIICLQIIVGVVVYMLLNVKYINSIIDLKKYIIRRKFDEA